MKFKNISKLLDGFLEVDEINNDIDKIGESRDDYEFCDGHLINFKHLNFP